MGRVSKAKLTEERLKEITNNFTNLIASLNNTHEIENFLSDFLTKEEKIMLSKRLMLFMMIKKDYSPSQIGNALSISFETTRNYANQLLGKNPIFQKIINKMIEKEKMKEFWSKIDKILKPIGLLMNARNDMNARTKFASGDWS